MKTVGIVALFVAFIFVACRSRATAESADRDAVKAASEQYRQAWLQGDTATALGLVSDDIRIFISGIPDIRGQEATRALFVSEMATYRVTALDLDRQDLIVGGDHAIDIGTYVEIQLPKTGAPIRGTGRYMTIWRREPGGWKIVRYMLNSLPPEGSNRTRS